MDLVEKRVRGSARGLALIGLAGLLVLAIMTTLDVLLRWLFAAPLHGVNDVSAVVMAVVVAACIPANLAFKQNITVNVLGTALGSHAERAFEVLASLLTLVFVTLMAWQFVPYAAGLKETGEQTWVLAWPVWPWWVCAAAMLILAALVQVLVLAADIRALVTGGGAVAHDEPPVV